MAYHTAHLGVFTAALDGTEVPLIRARFRSAFKSAGNHAPLQRDISALSPPKDLPELFTLWLPLKIF
jgi:hypothetical protein